MPASAVALEPRRELRQPRFEGYKLRPGDDADVHRHRHALPRPPLHRKVTANLPFQQLKWRAQHNALVPSPFDARLLAYVDRDGAVWAVRVHDAARVDIDLLLPAAREAVTAAAADGDDLPSAAFAARDLLVLSTGAGELTMAIGDDDAPWEAALRLSANEVGLGRLSVLAAASSPVDQRSRTVFVLVLSTTTAEEQASVVPTPGIGAEASSAAASTAQTRARTVPRFMVTLLSVPVSRQNDSAQRPPQCTRVCTLTAPEPPMVATLHVNETTGEPSIALGSPQPFVADVPSTTMDIDTAAGPATRGGPPAYAWTQTSEDVTVYVTLPTPVSKHEVDCRIGADRVRLRVRGGAVPHAFDDVKLFSTVDPSSSVWTLEKGLLLTLHLEKDLKDQDDGVLEIMDEQEIVAIREAFDRFSSDNPAGPRGLQPTLERVDEECDVEGGGSSFTVCRYDTLGRMTHSTPTNSTQELLAPGPLGRSVLTKWDVDGVVYDIDLSQDSLRMTNVGCFSAFAYVAASKRQKRLIVWAPDHSLIALVDATRHVYLYHQLAEPRATRADQRVVDLGHATGDILGACFAASVLVLLTAHELIALIS